MKCESFVVVFIIIRSSCHGRTVGDAHEAILLGAPLEGAPGACECPLTPLAVLLASVVSPSKTSKIDPPSSLKASCSTPQGRPGRSESHDSGRATRQSSRARSSRVERATSARRRGCGRAVGWLATTTTTTMTARWGQHKFCCATRSEANGIRARIYSRLAIPGTTMLNSPRRRRRRRRLWSLSVL